MSLLVNLFLNTEIRRRRMFVLYLNLKSFPQIHEGFSWQDAEQAFVAAQEIKEFVLKRVKMEIKSHRI